MALRLIEMVLREKDGGEVRELLKEHKVLEHRQCLGRRKPPGPGKSRGLPAFFSWTVKGGAGCEG
jgi:hypothetical protein